MILSALAHLPQGALSRSFGRCADLRLPRRLRPPILAAAARALKIDLTEAERPLGDYASLNELFVRRLKPGCRPICADPHTVISPVDSLVGIIGTIRDGLLLQVKARSYSCGELLDDPEKARRFEGGEFLTLYLTPRHYHRIHSPLTGVVTSARHVPGGLLPVNPPAAATVDGLFARNERLVCHLRGAVGRVAVIAVGAFNVGRISAAFDAEWNDRRRRPPAVTNRRNAQPVERRYDPPSEIQRGQEIMAFHLGSTVVVLFEPGKVRLGDNLSCGDEVRFGEPIGRGILTGT